MHSDEIRASFLEFFRERGHVVERSDTIVPSNDPTLLFSSAGMVQFKQYYTGEVAVPYRRATTAQKCLRAGGKANDLDEVGKTSRHMTFFEMMGNFSFGDYFKQDAIRWGWEYSTEVLKIDPALIYVSVYEEDDESWNIWEKEIGLPASHLVRLGAKDNFWGPAGDTGACGPCSELHLDRGEQFGCGEPDCAPGCERCERFLEFWNLVFPQFDQQLDGSRPTLKNRGIDTGMGLERVASIKQNVETVFDTSGIVPIIEATQSLCKVKYADNPTPFRVIADHARALSFMIADGVLPGNEGRGYVERRLLRRAARFGRELGFEKPFLYDVAQTVVDIMNHQYPELEEKRKQIGKIIQLEEERFASTLSRGMDLLDEIFEGMEKKGEKTVPGAELFKLHDTFGFPLDLATDISEDRGYMVDRDGFEASMAQQREKARSAGLNTGAQTISRDIQKTFDSLGNSKFVGYETLETDATVVAIFKNESQNVMVKETKDSPEYGAVLLELGKRVDKLCEGDAGLVVLDTTPFYAESGGQAGDIGILESANGDAHVSNAKAPLGKMTLHEVNVVRGTLTEGAQVRAIVNGQARAATANHHTATHLMQAVLQDVLGDHVHQAGSQVNPERLRFDFTHFEGIDADRLQDIERQVNALIRANTPVDINEMALNEARDAGAMALFGEKYGDTVRVVTVGDTSMELCGGTHVPSTGVIGYCKILSESSIASGVRRIEAVCGEPCVDLLLEHERQLSGAAQALATAPEQLAERLRALMDDNKRLEREVAKWKQAAATGGSVDYMSQVKDVSGVKLLAVEIQGQDSAGLRMVMDNLREKLPSGVIVLGAADEGKAMLCVGVSKDLTNQVKAGDIVKRLAAMVGGGGGGRPDMAQAGGKNPEKLPEAIAAAEGVVTELLG